MPEELQLFSSRIVRGLTDRPLEISAQQHREEVADLLRQLGEATFYHLLGLDPGSSAREVHDAYEKVARRVHPSQARRLGLQGKEAVLELLFEQATLAYLTLIDLDRRKAYDRNVGPARWTALRSAAVSKEEEAVRCFERARLLAESDQVHAAIELLKRSVALASNAEAWGLLGLLQARNPHWLEDAAASLKRAIEQGAKDPELPAALQEVEKKIQDRPEVEIAGRDLDGEPPTAPIPFRKNKKGR
jgi:curved DNA-binding protein CbpA